MWHQLQKGNQEISFNSLIKLKMFPAHDCALWPQSRRTLRHMLNFKHTKCSTEVNRTIYMHKVKYKLKCVSGSGPKGSVPRRVQARRLWLDGLTEPGGDGEWGSTQCDLLGPTCPCLIPNNSFSLIFVYSKFFPFLLLCFHAAVAISNWSFVFLF